LQSRHPRVFKTPRVSSRYPTCLQDTARVLTHTVSDRPRPHTDTDTDADADADLDTDADTDTDTDTDVDRSRGVNTSTGLVKA